LALAIYELEITSMLEPVTGHLTIPLENQSRCLFHPYIEPITKSSSIFKGVKRIIGPMRVVRVDVMVFAQPSSKV
jgi:hypothetical protein